MPVVTQAQERKIEAWPFRLESIDDLVPFNADEYVDGLFEEKW